MKARGEGSNPCSFVIALVRYWAKRQYEFVGFSVGTLQCMGDFSLVLKCGHRSFPLHGIGLIFSVP